MSWAVGFMFFGALANFGVAAHAFYILGTGLTILTGLNLLIGVVLVVLAIRAWRMHD